jgi:hypothetical protein
MQQVGLFFREFPSSLEFALIDAPNSRSGGGRVMPLFLFLPLIILSGLWAIGAQQEAPPNPE